MNLILAKYIIITSYKTSMKTWTKAIIGVVIAIVVIFAAVLVYQSYQVANTVTVTAIDESIVYNGATSGYLGATSQSTQGFTSTVNNVEVITLTFYTSATLLTHEITAVTVDASSANNGFNVAQITPSLPYSFSPGSTVTISISINLPSSAFSGVLDLVVFTQ
jgi:hypothetical protein